jgi:hypothetical protein
MVFDMFRACQTCIIQPFTKRQRKDDSDKTGTTVFLSLLSESVFSFSRFAQGWIIKSGEDTELAEHYSHFLNFLVKKRILPDLNR